MSVNLSEATKYIRLINEAYPLTQIENGNERWRKLQEARETYPALNELIEDYIEHKPEEVFDFLCDDAGIDKNLIAIIDPKRQIRKKVEAIITTIQTLYKEREKADA
jgi:hypothetical protein